jgi:fatty aldehyde-generating acyl-ACP reductase
MFGLIGHLTSLAQAQSVARNLGYDEFAEHDLEFWCVAPPQMVDEVAVTSTTTGKTVYGQYVESCFLPEMLAQKRFKAATRKIINAMAFAQKRGINITALGGFSSIIFENFNLDKIKHIRNVTLELERFTTGNTHTAYVLGRQVQQGADQCGIDLKRATVAVIGATGDIGSGLCRWLTEHTPVQELVLVARDQERLQNLRSELGSGLIQTIHQALSIADIVVWVASMGQGLDLTHENGPDRVLHIDGGYPKNMAKAPRREGVYVLDGGIVEHSLDIEWKLMNIINHVANPARQIYACFAESILLEFEQLYTNFSWGRNQITVEKIDEIGRLSIKHGFKPLLFKAADGIAL